MRTLIYHWTNVLDLQPCPHATLGDIWTDAARVVTCPACLARLEARYPRG